MPVGRPSGPTSIRPPLGCAVALKVLDVIERDRLADHVRTTGDLLKARITKLSEDHPGVVKSARGLGFMLGIELQDRSRIRAFSASDKPASIQFVNRLHEAGVLTIPSGNQIARLLPALNLPRSQAEEGMDVIEGLVKSLA